MVGASPLIGSGPGMYSWVRLEFPPAGADLLAVRLLHNVPLQTLVEGGLVLLGAAVRRARDLGRWPRRLAPGTVAERPDRALPALVGFARRAHSSTTSATSRRSPPRRSRSARSSCPSRHPRDSPAALAPPAVLGARRDRGASERHRRRRRARRGAGRAHRDGRRATTPMRSAGFEAATAAHPENGGYWLGPGHGIARTPAMSRRAIDAYERATVAAPGDPRGYAGAGGPGSRCRCDRAPASCGRSHPRRSRSTRSGWVSRWPMHGQLDEATQPGGARSPCARSSCGCSRTRIRGIVDGAVADEAVRDHPGRAAAGSRRRPRASCGTSAWRSMSCLPMPGPAWRAVDAARHGDLGRGPRELAEPPWPRPPYDARGLPGGSRRRGLRMRRSGRAASRSSSSASSARVRRRPSLSRESGASSSTARRASGPRQPPGVGRRARDRAMAVVADRPARRATRDGSARRARPAAHAPADAVGPAGARCGPPGGDRRRDLRLVAAHLQRLPARRPRLLDRRPRHASTPAARSAARTPTSTRRRSHS